MPDIILLTGETEFPFLSDLLRPYAGSAEISHAGSLEDLKRRCRTGPERHRRLIGFCTSVIVPEEIISSLDGNCYNFHPAPPSYPGYHPASFAIYNRATIFGATAHRMTATVDDGEIVGTGTFAVPPDCNLGDLLMAAYSATASLFSELAPKLAKTDVPLPPVQVEWGGHTYRKADHERMRKITASMDRNEMKRRLEAFGEIYSPLPTNSH